MYLLGLLDDYAATWPYLFIGLTELVIVAHVYGFENFLNDLHQITGLNPRMWAKLPLGFIYRILAPLIISVSVENVEICLIKQTKHLIFIMYIYC